METSPCAPLVMAEADFLLEVLIITLDSPAQLGEIDEVAERHVGVDRREPELCGRSFMLGPFDQECLFGKSRFTSYRGGTHAYLGKARPQLRVATLPPRDGAPGVLGQAARQGFDADALRLRITSPTGRTLTVETMAAT